MLPRSLAESGTAQANPAATSRRIYLLAGVGAFMIHAVFFILLGYHAGELPQINTGTEEQTIQVTLEAPGDGELEPAPELLDFETTIASPVEELEIEIPPEEETLPEEIYVQAEPEITLPSLAVAQDWQDIPPSPSTDLDLIFPVQKEVKTATRPPGRSPSRNTAGRRTQSGPGASGNSHSSATGSGTIPPRYKINPKPPYPSSARQNGNEGTVRLSVSLDANGDPQSVTLLRSSGHPELDKAAQDYVKARWKFYPARREGQNVPWTVVVPVIFNLKNA